MEIECLVIGEVGEGLLCNIFLKTLTEGAVTTEAGSLFQYFTTLADMPTISFGVGSHLGVPCRGALLGRIEREGGKTSSDQYPKGP